MTDGEDVRTRVEDALRRAAATAYAAAHGALEERDDDDAGPRWRFKVSPRVAVTAGLVLALTGAMLVFLPPDAPRFTSDLAGGAAPSSPASPSSAAIGGLPVGTVVVHVAGAVAAPGLYTIAGGGRVADAIAAAGGTTDEADVDALNLARVVVDGEQVRVPLMGEPANVDARININVADAAVLEGLPGVGPVLAKRIAAYRDAHGLFVSVDALDDVSGVGPAVLEKIRATATV